MEILATEYSSSPPLAHDEWSTLFNKYLDHMLCLGTQHIESKRIDYVASVVRTNAKKGICKQMVPEFVLLPTDGALDVIRECLNELREAESRILSTWSSLIESTFRGLRAETESSYRRNPATYDRNDGWVSLWESRIKCMVRIAPVNRATAFNPRVSEKRWTAIQQFDIIQRLLSAGVNQTITQRASLEDDGVMAAFRSDEELSSQGCLVPDELDLLYGIPQLTFSLMPGSLPSNADSRRLIILLSILCYLANSTDMQTLQWAEDLIDQWMKESEGQRHDEGTENEDHPSMEGPVCGGSLIYALADRTENLSLVRKYIEAKFVKTILETAPAANFQLLRSLPVSLHNRSYWASLMASGYIQGHQHLHFYGSSRLRDDYETLLLRFDKPSSITAYLMLWLCLYDRLNGGKCHCSSLGIIDQSATQSNDHLYCVLSSLRDVVHHYAVDVKGFERLQDPTTPGGGAAKSTGEEDDSQDGATLNPVTSSVVTSLQDYALKNGSSVLRPSSSPTPSPDFSANGARADPVAYVRCGTDGHDGMSDDALAALKTTLCLHNVFRYCLQQDLDLEGQFTRSLICLLHSREVPDWFNAQGFVIWCAWAGVHLDIPYILQHLNIRHREFTPFQTIVTAMREYYKGKTTYPKNQTGTISELLCLLGALNNNTDMKNRCASMWRMPLDRLMSPLGLLHSFVHNSIAPFHNHS